MSVLLFFKIKLVIGLESIIMLFDTSMSSLMLMASTCKNLTLKQFLRMTEAFLLNQAISKILNWFSI